MQTCTRHTTCTTGKTLAIINWKHLSHNNAYHRYDLLRRAVFDVPPRPKPYKGNRVKLRLYPTDLDRGLMAEYVLANVHWLRFTMVSNLPYLHGWLPSTDTNEPVQGSCSDSSSDACGDRAVFSPSGVAGLFMLDSGAGGADVILHEEVAAWAVPPAQRDVGARTLKVCRTVTIRGDERLLAQGVGGSETQGTKVERGRIQELELRDGPGDPQLVPEAGEPEAGEPSTLGVRFEQLSCFMARNSGLDVSRYTAGILCGDLLARQRVVYDYANKRVGFAWVPIARGEPPPPKRCL